jgi:hypothetical protein
MMEIYHRKKETKEWHMPRKKYRPRKEGRKEAYQGRKEVNIYQDRKEGRKEMKEGIPS